MATSLVTFRNQVEILLDPNDANTELADSDIDKMIKDAVERYSRDFPDDETDDVSGDGGRYYALTTSLDNWTEGFSHILQIEFPAPTVADDEVPTYLDAEDWHDDYWASDTRYLFLPNHAPGNSDTMRIKYTKPYTWTGTPEGTDTPTEHFYAICHLAAGLCCRAIASKYSRSSDATIAADSVNHMTRAQEFRAQARRFIEEYEMRLGLADEERPPDAAGEFVDWNTQPAFDRRWLAHRKRR